MGVGRYGLGCWTCYSENKANKEEEDKWDLVMLLVPLLKPHLKPTPDTEGEYSNIFH